MSSAAEQTAISVEKDVKCLKEWFKTQPHLPQIELNDVMVGNLFLRSKSSIEKSKEKLDMYFTIRSLIPDMFQDSNPKILSKNKNFDFVHIISLPTMDQSLILMLKATEPGKLDPQLLMKQLINILEIKLRQECLTSEILIYDCKNVSFEDILTVSPTLVAKCLALYQKMYSIRFKAAYLINCKSYIHHILSIVKPMLKPKLRARIHIDEGLDILKKVLPNNLLPCDYGGEGLSSIELLERTKLELQKNQELFDFLETLEVDENERPTKLCNDEILGFYGNFKKLDID